MTTSSIKTCFEKGPEKIIAPQNAERTFFKPRKKKRLGSGGVLRLFFPRRGKSNNLEAATVSGESFLDVRKPEAL